MIDCYIALGSNLAIPQLQLRRAVAALKHLPRSRFLDISGFYRNAGVGTSSQSEYVNAVARLQTSLHPLELLRQMQRIENRFGRRRVAARRWQARKLDLDLLLYGQRQIRMRHLTVPHALMLERDFVLIPLQEIAPEGLQIPGHGRLESFLTGIDSSRLHRTNHV